MIEKFLKRSSWTDIIISIIFLLFGILLIARPEATVGAITIVLGIIFIAMGILKLIEYYSSETKEDYLLTISIVEVIIGVIMLFASDTVLSVIKAILGVWVIIEGILDLQTTLVWKQVKSPYWTLAVVLSILMILAGIIIITSKDLIITTLGIIIVVYAVLDIIDRVIFMKKIDDYAK